jgi:putative hydrolase of the HAD superfamily
VGKVRAVLFDLDDTLFDHTGCARAALLGVRDAHECFARFDAGDIEEAHARILEALHLEVMTGRRDLDAARIERFRRLYAWAGIDADDDLAVRAALTYKQGYIDARAPVRGAAPLLAAVRRRAAVVVVSNNLLAEQQEKLAHCGLAREVDVLVVSGETGMAKPDPRIFEIALERARVSAAEAVMVGDSWANDVEGARAAGIRAIWFNREGVPAPSADVRVIRGLEPLDDVLGVILGDRRAGAARTESASALQR